MQAVVTVVGDDGIYGVGEGKGELKLDGVGGVSGVGGVGAPPVQGGVQTAGDDLQSSAALHSRLTRRYRRKEHRERRPRTSTENVDRERRPRTSTENVNGESKRRNSTE